MNPQILSDLRDFLPELAVAAGFLAVIVADLLFEKWRSSVTFALTAAGLLAALVLTLQQFGGPAKTLFFDMIALDDLAVFFKGFLILTSFLILLAAPGARELARSTLGEFYSLLLGVTLGMMLLVSSIDLLMLFLALEMVSLGSYVMVGYLSTERQSNEASLKYLLFGAVSTGAMLYGLTLLFGLTGTTKMYAIREALGQSLAGENSLMLLVTAVLIFAGFGFKTAAVPFHFWCPDVYTGAPTPVTAFLSVAPKAAGFAALVRFFFTGMAGGDPAAAVWNPLAAVNWPLLLLLVSIVTMTFGNLAALRQDNMKRMLAYSSIAHAGYILMGAVVLSAEGIQAILIYLVTYLFMNLGAFLIVIEIHKQTGSFDVNDYKGLYARSPFLTIAMTVFMLSLMGIPPFAGFFGKLFVFAAAVNRDLAWFAVIGALNSVIAVYYYARVIKSMVIEDGTEVSPFGISWSSGTLVLAMLIPTAFLALIWNWIQKLTGASVRLFIGA